jgi:protein gp37
MNKTKIEWCDSTWNPVTGCKHGCQYCYARGIANRFKGYDRVISDSGVISSSDFAKFRYVLFSHLHRRTKKGEKVKAAYPFGFEPTLHRYKLGEPQEWKNPRNVFVGDMTDLFGDFIPDEWIADVFAACAAASQHQYLFLTKNPERYTRLVLDGIIPAQASGKADNLWLGSTVTEPETTYWWGEGYNIFLSIEPLAKGGWKSGGLGSLAAPNWVIVGAESGNRKGKVKPEREWVDEIVNACDYRGTPVFMKESLLPIMGEENMRRDYPAKMRKDNRDV